MSKSAKTSAGLLADELATVDKMIANRQRQLASCERMLELLKPEWDKFEARSGHDVYVARDYADHSSAARTHRKEIAALTALRQSAAPASEAGEWTDAKVIEFLGRFNDPTDNSYGKDIRATIRALRAALRSHERMREALKRLEQANEELAAQRSDRTYHSIIQDGAEDLLLVLDNARAGARTALRETDNDAG